LYSRVGVLLLYALSSEFFTSLQTIYTAQTKDLAAIFGFRTESTRSCFCIYSLTLQPFPISPPGITISWTETNTFCLRKYISTILLDYNRFRFQIHSFHRLYDIAMLLVLLWPGLVGVTQFFSVGCWTPQ
jgi:hypothetical protein